MSKKSLKKRLLVGGLIVGALYLAYQRGRSDEIKDILNLVLDQGETTMTFTGYSKVVKIAMQQVS